MLIRVLIMLIPFLLLCLYVVAPRWAYQTQHYGVMMGLIVVTALIPCLIVGGVIVLSGYFVEPATMVTTQQITQDTTIRSPKQEIPPPPIERIII